MWLTRPRSFLVSRKMIQKQTKTVLIIFKSQGNGSLAIILASLAYGPTSNYSNIILYHNKFLKK